jgi:hypothetical protein
MCSPCPARMVAEDFSMSRELHRPLRPPGGGDIAISVRTCDAGGIAHKRCHLCAFETPVDRFERRGQVAISAAIPANISSTSHSRQPIRAGGILPAFTPHFAAPPLCRFRAVSVQSIKTGPEKGLARKQTAPAFTARTRRLSSGKAVMKINGASLPRARIFVRRSVHIGHPHIRNDARRVVQAARLQELNGRRKCVYQVSVRAEKVIGRGAD